MSTEYLPPDQYYATLPRHIAGAGVIFHDAEGRFLLVKPTYRDDWEIPGGGLDAGEDPVQAARREIKEELGFDLTPGRLLAVDWVPEQPDGRPPLANYLFDGGRTTEQHLQELVHLDTTELSQWELAAPDRWGALLAPHMVRRLHACARALAGSGTPFLQHGFDPAHPST